MLFLAVGRLLWHKPWKLIALGAAVFLTVDGAFFAADLTKIVHGGWLPLALASGVFFVLMTWSKGRQIVTRQPRQGGGPAARVHRAGRRPRFAGAATWRASACSSTRTSRTTPLALRANVELNHVLHERVIIISVQVERVPHVPEADRVVVEPGILFSGATGEPLPGSADRFSRLTLRFGFLDEPDIPTALRQRSRPAHARRRARHCCALSTSSRRSRSLPTDDPGMNPWRKKFFVAMARNAANPAEYFRLPDDQTVTMSGRVDL